MTTIGLATERAAAGIAKVYVDAWRSTYAALLPHRMLLGMSYERQMTLLASACSALRAVEIDVFAVTQKSAAMPMRRSFWHFPTELMAT